MNYIIAFSVISFSFTTFAMDTTSNSEVNQNNIIIHKRMTKNIGKMVEMSNDPSWFPKQPSDDELNDSIKKWIIVEKLKCKNYRDYPNYFPPCIDED